MSAASEQLRLVTDFAELRHGVPVRLKPCPFCGSSDGHRGIVVSFLPNARGLGPDFTVRVFDAWVVRPAPACSVLDKPDLISRRTVADGFVFRVVDGLEDPAIYAAEIEAVEILARAGVRPVTTRSPATSRISFMPERRR